MQQGDDRSARPARGFAPRVAFSRAFHLGLAMLLGGAVPAAAAPRLWQGDILVVDDANSQILYVDPLNGHYEVFSPRDGAPNLLVHPSGIEIDPEGVIFVANEGANDLVAIDPTTGAQSVVHAHSGFQDLGVLDVGQSPSGLDLRTYIGTLSDLPDLFVARPGEIREVLRSSLNTTSTSFSTDAGLASQYNSIAIRESGATLLDLFVAGYAGLSRYDAAGGTLSVIVATDMFFSVEDVDWTPARLTFSAQAPCGEPNGSSGVYEYVLPSGPALPLLIGDPVDCPTAHRQVSATELYVVDGGGKNPTPLVRLSDSAAGWRGDVVARLPYGSYFHLAVAPVTFAPEPAIDSCGATALVGIGLFAVARRPATPRRARRGRSAATA